MNSAVQDFKKKLMSPKRKQTVGDIEKHQNQRAKSLKATTKHSLCDSKSQYEKQPCRDAHTFEERRGISVLKPS